MEKRTYIVPEIEEGDMYLESIIMVSGGENTPGDDEVGNSDDIEAKAWGGSWFDDGYDE